MVGFLNSVYLEWLMYIITQPSIPKIHKTLVDIGEKNEYDKSSIIIAYYDVQLLSDRLFRSNGPG